MAYSSITKPTDYFNTVLYNGTGSSNSVTGVGFQPDWVWLKHRNGANNHCAYDAIRGVQKTLHPDLTNAESTDANNLTAFGTDGFTVGSGTNVNGSSGTYVSWNWLGANGTTSNSDGSITSTVSANTTAGFSIVSFTGNATAGATIGHGLGVTPKWVIVKNRSNAQNWFIYHEEIGATKVIYLDLTNAQQTLTQGWNDTAPTSSVVSLGTEAGTNQSGANMIAYCFAEKKGYSKFGSYIGNQSTAGPFVFTGFRPAFVMVKRTDSTSDWLMCDNKRPGFNPIDDKLFANTNQAEDPYEAFDFVSNGFKVTSAGTGHNASGANMIYMAFAENPFVGNDSGTAVPVTAR